MAEISSSRIVITVLGKNRPGIVAGVTRVLGEANVDIRDITQQQLDAAYPEFLGAPERCRFASCSHVSEPECAVKALLTSGQLSSGRYARYIEIHNEIEKRRTLVGAWSKRIG